MSKKPAKTAKQEEDDDALRYRSYRTSDELHAHLESIAKKMDVPLYQVMDAAIMTFNPEKNPEHKMALEEAGRQQRVRKLTRELQHLSVADRKAVIKNLIPS